MNRYPKRLIEVDLPIARISAHARREKSIRHGHIATLHIWWARRPLAACRAVICASLWPDPADELCPQAFRELAVKQMVAFANRVFPKRITEEGRLLSNEKSASPESLKKWSALANGELLLDPSCLKDMEVLRLCLLDFIADFSNWDNSIAEAYLQTSRALTQAAHESVGGLKDTRPLAVDPFAGGGSIPLESIRVGSDVFASDLNPVAVLLNKVVLEYAPAFGPKLASEVSKWGEWVKRRAEKELSKFYPTDPDGATPIAYIWARTILSEAPGQEEEPIEVPMLRSMWLSKVGKNKCALRWLRNKAGQVETERVEVVYAGNSRRAVRRPLIEIFSPKRASEVENATVARGSVTCPVTGFTTPVSSVRDQLRKRSGGSKDARLICVVSTRKRESGRFFRVPIDQDVHVANAAGVELTDRMKRSNDELALVPDEPMPIMSGVFNAPIYGHNTWGSLYTNRQLLIMTTLARLVREAGDELRKGGDPIADAVQTCLAMAVDRQADHGNTGCTWNPSGPKLQHLFGRQAIPMTWDFAEANPFGDSVGDWMHAIECVNIALENAQHFSASGSVDQCSASNHPLPDDSVQLLVTDPPYYNAVPYADLSDFLYVWLKRTLRKVYPQLLATELTPKSDEICEMAGWDPVRYPEKDAAWYEGRMAMAMQQARRYVVASGIGVIVFAHKTTIGWETMLQALLQAGWTVTASWPLDTEMGTRLRAMNSAALGSSVHIICRPRENADGTLRNDVGEWRDVLSELPKRIHDWMPRLASEGVVGADAIFACLGPALEIFSRYSRVEKASGESVPLREYLEQVWAAVSTEALSMIFRDADAAGLEPDARLTAMWLWTLGNSQSKDDLENRVVGAIDDALNETDEEDDEGNKKKNTKGYFLEYDAARKIAQGLGIHLEQSDSVVEVKGDTARLLPVGERVKYLFGKDVEADSPKGRKKKRPRQQSLFEELDEIEAEVEIAQGGELKPQAGETILDRLHQAMILFGSGRGEAMRRFLVDDGAGRDSRLWKLAQSLSALYPAGSDEKRWVDGVLARKKGLGL
jgi:putative DNA methylase